MASYPFSSEADLIRHANHTSFSQNVFGTQPPRARQSSPHPKTHCRAPLTRRHAQLQAPASPSRSPAQKGRTPRRSPRSAPDVSRTCLGTPTSSPARPPAAIHSGSRNFTNGVSSASTPAALAATATADLAYSNEASPYSSMLLYVPLLQRLPPLTIPISALKSSAPNATHRTRSEASQISNAWTIALAVSNQGRITDPARL